MLESSMFLALFAAVMISNASAAEHTNPIYEKTNLTLIFDEYVKNFDQNRIYSATCNRSECKTKLFEHPHFDPFGCSNFNPNENEICIGGTRLRLEAYPNGYRLIDAKTDARVGHMAIEDQMLSPSSLRLLGRGVHKGSSDESIALACFLDDDCKRVRFIHFIDQEHIQWIGTPFEITPMNSKAQSLEVQRYLIKHGTVPPFLFDTKTGRTLNPIIVFVAPIFTHKLAVALTTVFIEGALITFAPGLIYIATAFLIVPRQARFISNRASGEMTLTHGQDGWNWSEAPRRMRKKKFDHLLANIKAPINHNYTQQRQNALYRYERKIERAKKRN